jgi:carboxymethylenebutenolidase
MRGAFDVSAPLTRSGSALAATWPAYNQALNAAHVPLDGYIYPGAVHGFNCDATPEWYNKGRPIWPGTPRSTDRRFNKYVRG